MRLGQPKDATHAEPDQEPGAYECPVLSPRALDREELLESEWFERDEIVQLPRVTQLPDSSLATASIQSMARSESEKPPGPSSPTHQASGTITPPAAVISLTIPGGTVSPL